jgi:cell division protein FtsB
MKQEKSDKEIKKLVDRNKQLEKQVNYLERNNNYH